MGKFGAAVFAVLLAALVLFAGCVGKTGGPSGNPSGNPSASEGTSGGVSQEEFSSLESELAGLEGNESLFVADEFESDILG